MKNRHSALFRPYHLPLRRTARTRQQICSPCTGPSGSVWLSPRRYHPLFVTRQTRCRTYCPSNRRNSTISPRFGGCVHFTSRTASRPWMRNGAILAAEHRHFHHAARFRFGKDRADVRAQPRSIYKHARRRTVSATVAGYSASYRQSTASSDLVQSSKNAGTRRSSASTASSTRADSA